MTARRGTRYSFARFLATAMLRQSSGAFFRNLAGAVLAVALACPVADAETPLSPGEHNVVLNGVRLWYKVAGTAQPQQAPLLYLHGGPGYNSYSFEKTIGARLETHALVIYLDQRGSGRSERPWDKNYQMSALVADVEALRVSLGVPRIIPMGHSFGGTIALEYAARYPQRVQKLIILDGAADMPASLGEWQIQIQQKYPDAWKFALNSTEGKALQDAISKGAQCAITKAAFAVDTLALSRIDQAQFHHEQQFHDRRFQTEQDALDAKSGLTNTSELSTAYFGPTSDFPCYRFSAHEKLTMPVLVVVGRYDGAVGVKSMRSLANQLPHAKFDEFELSAHFPYAEEPDKFERDLAAFLSG
jgi:proline iminopeptidase